MMKHYLLTLSCVVSTLANAQTINTGPYLQDAEPTSIRIMWESTTGDESTVLYGTTQALGSSALGTIITGSGASRIHEVQLTGLTPATRYWYTVQTGSATSGPFDLITPALQSDEDNFSFVAVSDMQRDFTNPTVWGNIVDLGIIPYTAQTYTGDLPTDLSFMMIPGDLVDNGTNYSEWEQTFFDPAQNLFQHVPVYPVAGNHEQDSPNYFKYHHLPDNGTAGYEEHWWYKDHSNVRIIGLESNGGYRIQAQLDWLQATLDQACADADIDFVFAQLHHPHHSELWPDGNLDYTGQCIALLEQFSTNCGKPSVHFFGHTHGYSRGESRDHRHVMMNVAVAGGNIDYWGEYANQTDYPEYSISDDDYGFVMIDVEAGADPGLFFSRLSRGDATTTLNNVLTDTMRVRFFDIQPVQPIGLFPAQGDQLAPDCIIFKGSPYNDPNNTEHGGTHWQIATDANFTNLIFDEWKQHQNWYNAVDLQANDDLTDEQVNLLQENSTYHWRVRYRNRGLTWSAWSNTISFQTTTSNLTPNLLQNSGAENGTTNWTAIAGVIEMLTANECGATVPYAGSKFFCVGGACTDNAYGEAYQDVDVSAYSATIDGGEVTANFGAYMRNWSGNDDHPEMALRALDQSGVLIAASANIGTLLGAWTPINGVYTLPVGTRTIRTVLMGTRNVGGDNDSYLDEVSVRINLNPEACAQMPVSISDDMVDSHPAGLYPNPNHGSFTILDQDGMVHIQITDALGRQVFDRSMGGQINYPIELSNIEAGLYVAHVTDQQGHISAIRFIRAH